MLPLLLTIIVGQFAQAQICSWSSTQSNVRGVTPVPAPNGSFVDYTTIDINLDQNCQGIFQFSFINSTFGNACNFIEYYDQNGVLVGQENTSIPGSSTFTFNNTHIDGAVNARSKKYYFICAKALASNTCNEFRAIFINSVTDRVGPTFVNFPIDRDILCSSSSVPTVTGNIVPNSDVRDNCSFVTSVVPSDVDDPTRKGQAYRDGRICFVKKRTWTAFDDKGNSAQRVQNITVYDNSAPGFTSVSFNSATIVPSEIIGSSFNADRVFAYSPATVSCDNITAVFDAFRPAPTDNCGIVGTATEITPIGGELVGRINNPTLPDFYNYSIRRTWQTFDNCGFTSIAYRDYQVRDMQSPTVAPTFIHPGTTAPILTANTNTSKAYIVAEQIALSGCNPILRLTPTLSDNCSATEFLVATYRLEVFNTTTNSYQFFTSGNYSSTAGIILQPEKLYRVILEYKDPVGNTTQLTATAKTSSPTVSILCTSTPVEKPINSNGTTQIGFLEFLDQATIVAALSNVCSSTTALTFRMKRTSDATWTEGIGAATIINGLPNLIAVTPPELTFNCSDVGKTIQVEGQIRDASTGQVIASCIRTANILPSQDGTINAVRFVTPASSPTTADGQIALNISTVPAVSQNFNIVWTGPVSGSANGVLPNYNITGLSPGTYTITITGTSTCASAVITETVIGSIPLQLGYVCPINILPNGTATVQLRALDGFENINALRFTITVQGIPNAVLGAPVSVGSFPSISLSDYTTINAQRVDFNWTRSNGTNLPDGEVFLSFNVSIPSDATLGTNLIVQVGGGPNNIFQASQALGNGSNRNITPLIGTTCAVPVGQPTSSNLTVGGFVTYMSTGKPISAVNLSGTDDGINLVSTTTNATGAYNFTNISAGSNVSLNASFTGNASAFQINDIVLTKRYVLGNPAAEIGITSGYQLIAADVNMDGRVNTTDAVQMERALVGFSVSQNAFDVNSWAFVLGSQTIPISSLLPTLNSMFTGTVSTAVTNANFVGIKKGDVNQSANFTTANSLENRAVSLTAINNTLLEAGKTYFLNIHAKSIEDIAALQMELEYNQAWIEIEKVTPSKTLSEKGSFLYRIENGVAKIVWTDTEGVMINSNEAVVVLKVTALNSGKYLDEVLRVNESKDANTIYTSGLEAKNLKIQFVNDMLVEDAFELSVAPNPTKDRTVLMYNLPEASEVNLTIIDVSGKVIFTTKQFAARGTNRIQLEKGNQLPNTGVYFYVLATANDQQSGKIVIID